MLASECFLFLRFAYFLKVRVTELGPERLTERETEGEEELRIPCTSSLP